MNKRIHRSLTAILGSLTGISALLAATDPASLGLEPQAWAWCAVVLAAGNVLVTAFRTAFEAE